jgi:hypothetical protein
LKTLEKAIIASVCKTRGFDSHHPLHFSKSSIKSTV